MNRSILTILVILVLTGLAIAQPKTKPTLYCVGDSTVNNSTGDFKGWCNVFAENFDESKITIMNRARGGRSSRTFYSEGLWKQVADELKPGDFVLIQFGHNDGGPIDKEKFRGSLKGIGDEFQDITGQDGKPETVRTFGWYLRKFIADAKAKKATVVLLSPVPRNVWKDGKVERASGTYGLWSGQTAESEKVLFVDLNEISALKFEKAGAEVVGKQYFTTVDHTHTSDAGARLNAASVVEGLSKLKGKPFGKYLLKK